MLPAPRIETSMRTPSFNDPPLPEDDPDLRLARYLSQESDTQRLRLLDKDAASDPLLHLLAQEQEDLASQPVLAEARSEALWSRIEKDLQAAPAKQPKPTPRPAYRPTATIFSFLTPSFKYAFAAIIIVLIGVVAITQLSTPSIDHLPVLAEAQQVPVVYEAPDGSSITLRPYSTLFDGTSAPTPATYALDGEAYFDVAHDPSRTVSIAAGLGRVEVLGTSFNVSTWGQQTSLYLAEGSVRFSTATGTNAVMVTPGFEVFAQLDGTISTPTASEGLAATDWLQEEISFEATSVQHVIAELAHHFNVAIDVPAERLNERISGRFLLNNQARTFDDLGTLLGGVFTETAPSMYRFE